MCIFCGMGAASGWKTGIRGTLGFARCEPDFSVGKERNVKMKIDDNPIELEAMAAFHRGDSDGGHRLQDEFVKQFYESLKQKEDFCSCKADCKYHGRCMDCVTIHRGHGDHLPNCMHAILNRRLEKLSELSEHSILQKIGGLG